MTPRTRLQPARVTREDLDVKTRERMAANLRMLKHLHGFPSVNQMAEALGMTRQALNRYLKGERTIGLDVALRIHRVLHVSLDWLVDRDPAREWFDPEYDPPQGKKPQT